MVLLSCPRKGDQYAFTGNRAQDGNNSHAIYATSLSPYQVIKNGSVSESEYSLIDISEVFTVRRFNFDDDAILQPQLATDGASFHISKSTLLMVIPGKRYSHIWFDHD